MSEAKSMMNCGSRVTKYWCEDYAPDNCDECPNWSPKKPPTNGDRIRDMTDEELARLMRMLCPPDGKHGNGSHYCVEYRLDCHNCWLQWLRKEADNA